MPGRNQRSGQASAEYLGVYGMAILIIIIAAVALYAAFSSPASKIPNTCTFSGGVLCKEMVIGTNSSTGNTSVVMLLSNGGTTPIQSPSLVAGVRGQNTTGTCYPGYVKPGGSMICMVNLTAKTTAAQALSGSFYLKERSCAFSVGNNCQNPVNQTYMGSFEGTTQQALSYKIGVTLDAESNSLPPDGQRDNLTAQVVLLGSNMKGATINFTANSTVPILGGQICGINPSSTQPCSSFTNTNANGEALSDIWSYGNVIVKVYANFSGIASANTIIVFGNAYTPIQGSCHVPGPVKTYVLTDANYSQNPISASGSGGTYNVIKITNKPVTVKANGNGPTLYCFDIDTTVGLGVTNVNQNGNNENVIVYMSGDGNAVLSSNGNNENLLFDDSGNGPVSGSLNGNNGAFNITTGTGKVTLTVNGNNEAVSNITTMSSNAVFTINGNNQIVNVTDSASGAKVKASVGGNNQFINIVVAPGSTITASVNANNNVFNATGGSITITSISGNNNVFNVYNEAVTLNACSGNGNRVNLLAGSYYTAGSATC